MSEQTSRSTIIAAAIEMVAPAAPALPPIPGVRSPAIVVIVTATVVAPPPVPSVHGGCGRAFGCDSIHVDVVGCLRAVECVSPATREMLQPGFDVKRVTESSMGPATVQ